jgi:hypothetical protein
VIIKKNKSHKEAPVVNESLWMSAAIVLVQLFAAALVVALVSFAYLKFD